MAGRLVVDRAAVAALAGEPGVRRFVEDIGRQVATRAAGAAPRETGAGAASIRAEAVLADGAWAAFVSWDQLHAYMFFHEVGTRHLPARPFLRPAAR